VRAVNNKKDSKEVWQIRNHPLARKNFNNSDEIPFQNHKVWFEKQYFSDKDNYCFVFEDIEKKILGYCRFDFSNDEKTYIISVAVSPDSHGKGLGSILLSESLRQFKGQHHILAEIQKSNIPSMKLFYKNNFKIYKEDDKNYYLKYEF